MNLPDFKAIDKEFYFDGELGAIYSTGRTLFRVWAPLAEQVFLRLYRTPSESKPYDCIPMEKSGGVWCAEVSGDLHGIFYTY